jgi:oxygen-independent coproporphyrinogen-3 oxidase
MQVAVDTDLIRRYARPLPRYTSYPTAPHFSPDVGPEVFADEVQRSNDEADAGPLSLYLHLPFCRQLCYYCGCHMKVTHDPERISRYLSYLKRDIDRTAERIDTGRRVTQIHWGGGTPTYLSPQEIEGLGRHLRDRFRVADDAEISLEADPRELTQKRVEAARRVGFNRISIGVQDIDRQVQEAINRVQPEAQVRDAVRWAREAGFESVNLDLVYGLPHQTTEQFRTTIDTVLDIDPDRIALFSYAHVPSIKQHQQLINEEALPAPAEKLSIFEMALETLTGPGGYRFIGMDHFARPDDELARAQDAGTLYRNFQGYSTRAGADVYAFGISGIHQLAALYAQNVKGLRPYYDRLEDGASPVYRGYRLSDDDHLRRHVIMQLMCNFELDKRAVEQWADDRGTPIDFDVYFADALTALAPLVRDDLVHLSDDDIRVKPLGRLLVRHVAGAFDASLSPTSIGPTSGSGDAPSDQPTYSQSV